MSESEHPEAQALIDEVRRLADGVEMVVDSQRSERARISRDEREFLDSYKGRRQPRNLGLDLIIKGHPWMAGLFTTVVPSAFWIYDCGEIEIACPCGTEPRVVPGNFHACPGCERVFLATGTAVHVYNPDKTDSATVESVPSDEDAAG